MSPASRNRRDAPAQRVEALLDRLDHPLKAEILVLRRTILDVDPSIGEAVKWNAPSFHTSDHFATFHLRRPDRVQVVLHLGARTRPGDTPRERIADPAGLLEWRGADRALVTFTGASQVAQTREVFAGIVRQWLGFV